MLGTPAMKTHRFDLGPNWEVTRFHLVMQTTAGGVAAFALEDAEEVRRLIDLADSLGWRIQTFSTPQIQLTGHLTRNLKSLSQEHCPESAL